jgi:hypothetical protein
MMKSDWFAQMWGNKLYIMRYKMKPDKITFNPYKNNYEKLLESNKRRTLFEVALCVSSMILGILVSILVYFLTK